MICQNDELKIKDKASEDFLQEEDWAAANSG